MRFDLHIITEPFVHLLAKPQYFPLDVAKLPPHMNGTENIIAVGGKVCYDTYGEDGRPVEAHVQGLVKEKHGSVLEHVNVTFFIAGVSRGLSHEFVRHRAGFSYSQRSTRYADEDDCATVLNPEYARLYQGTLNGTATIGEQELIQKHLDGFARQLHIYGRSVEGFLQIAPAHLPPRKARKWARGNARQNLPHSLETRMVVTANLRAWRTFMNQRSGRGAEAEIRRLSNAIWPLLRKVSPNSFADVETEFIDGFLEIRCPAI